MISFFRPLILGFFTLILAACNAGGRQSDVTAVATTVFTQIQPTSIREGREYCGSIVRRSNGELYATTPIPGDESSCPAEPFFIYDTYRIGDDLVANYHTHSDYSPGGYAEVPSLQDMIVTGRFGVPSYVATPGGRFWFIYADGSVAYQICSVGCLPRDPDFTTVGDRFQVPQRLTREDLIDIYVR